ncbi:MAG: hypothetical protein ACYSWQ_14190 [Planctomycetota bacterium]
MNRNRMRYPKIAPPRLEKINSPVPIVSEAIIAPGPKTFSQSNGRRGNAFDRLLLLIVLTDVSSIVGPSALAAQRNGAALTMTVHAILTGERILSEQGRKQGKTLFSVPNFGAGDPTDAETW